MSMWSIHVCDKPSQKDFSLLFESEFEIHLATFAFIHVLNFKVDIVSERDYTSEDMTQ